MRIIYTSLYLVDLIGKSLEIIGAYTWRFKWKIMGHHLYMHVFPSENQEQPCTNRV